MDSNTPVISNEDIPSKKRKDYKKIILTALVVAISSTLANIAYDRYLRSDPDGEYEKSLLKASEQINTTCPNLVDAETRLDYTTVLVGNRFQYSYTLIHYSAEDFDSTELINAMKPTLKQQCRTNPSLQVFREHATELHYVYYDKQGNYFFKIIIHPEDNS